MNWFDWIGFLLLPPRCLHCHFPLQKPSSLCLECQSWLFFTEKKEECISSVSVLSVFDQEGPGHCLTQTPQSRFACRDLAAWMAIRWLKKEKEIDCVFPFSPEEKKLCDYFCHFLKIKPSKKTSLKKEILFVVSHLKTKHSIEEFYSNLHQKEEKIWLLAGTVNWL